MPSILREGPAKGLCQNDILQWMIQHIRLYLNITKLASYLIRLIALGSRLLVPAWYKYHEIECELQAYMGDLLQRMTMCWRRTNLN